MTIDYKDDLTFRMNFGPNYESGFGYDLHMEVLTEVEKETPNQHATKVGELEARYFPNALVSEDLLWKAGCALDRSADEFRYYALLTGHHEVDLLDGKLPSFDQMEPIWEMGIDTDLVVVTACQVLKGFRGQKLGYKFMRRVEDFFSNALFIARAAAFDPESKQTDESLTEYWKGFGFHQAESSLLYYATSTMPPSGTYMGNLYRK